MARIRERGANRRSFIGRWVGFVGIYIGLLLVFFSWPAEAYDRWLVRATAHVTARLLSVLGLHGLVAGEIVTSSIYSLRIISECTAIFPAMVFVAAVIAYPAPWSLRLKGITGGIPALLAVNQIRLVSLFLIGHWLPSRFEQVHMLIWPSLLVFCTILLWLFWSSRIEREDGR